MQAGRPHYKGPGAIVVAGFQPAIVVFRVGMSLKASEAEESETTMILWEASTPCWRDARTTMAKGPFEERTQVNCGGGRFARSRPIQVELFRAR